MAASSHVQHSQSNHWTESKDWANHGPLAEHEPGVSTVFKGSANNGPLAEHEPDVATVACPGCWRSRLKHLLGQPQERWDADAVVDLIFETGDCEPNCPFLEEEYHEEPFQVQKKDTYVKTKAIMVRHKLRRR